MSAAVESLVLEGLTRSFGGHTALDSLDLTIAGGEFVALKAVPSTDGHVQEEKNAGDQQ